MNIKKFGGTPPLLDHNHPVDVPFVLWKCPADILSNRRGITHQLGRDVPDVLGFAAETVLGTLPRHTDHQMPLCSLCLSVFASP